LGYLREKKIGKLWVFRTAGELSIRDDKGADKKDKTANPHDQEKKPSCRFHRNQYIIQE
jgi:hypothetical protein